MENTTRYREFSQAFFAGYAEWEKNGTAKFFLPNSSIEVEMITHDAITVRVVIYDIHSNTVKDDYIDVCDKDFDYLTDWAVGLDSACYN